MLKIRTLINCKTIKCQFICRLQLFQCSVLLRLLEIKSSKNCRQLVETCFFNGFSQSFHFVPPAYQNYMSIRQYHPAKPGTGFHLTNLTHRALLCSIWTGDLVYLAEFVKLALVQTASLLFIIGSPELTSLHHIHPFVSSDTNKQ